MLVAGSVESCNDGAILLATIARVVATVFEVPRITGGGRKDVKKQGVLWGTAGAGLGFM